MDKRTAKRIVEIFRQGAPRIKPKKVPERWAHKNPMGYFGVEKNKTEYSFFICVWNSDYKDRWYLVGFQGVNWVCEIWKEDGARLKWSYSPSKHDTHNNPKRKEKFEEIWGSTDVLISLPAKKEENSKFVKDMINLMMARLEADKSFTTPLSQAQSQLKESENSLLVGVSYKEKSKKKVLRHLTYERNAKLIRDAKKLHKAKGLEMRCEVCGFSFLEEYGKHGAGFIEGHHKVPFSKLSENTKLKPKDIALVCANCHRMIHHRHPWLTIKQLKKIWRDQNPQSGRR